MPPSRWPRAWIRRQAGPPATVDAPVELVLGDQVLALFTTLTSFGTPRDITLAELAVELFYPADATTEATLRALAPS